MSPRPTAADLAADLRRAEHEVRPIEFPSRRAAAEGWQLDWEYARAVAIARDELRLADGETRIGWKLGWTSAAMREALGIDQPNWGTLWDTQRVAVGAAIECAELLHPKVEPEFVRLGEGWHLGLEIVDPRFPSFEFTWLDNTLDNSSAARVVVGEPLPTGFDPSGEVDFHELDADGSVCATHQGSGAQVLGHPDRAVDWLRERVEVGDDELVFTGGLCAPFDVVAGRTYRLVAGGSSLEFSAR